MNTTTDNTAYTIAEIPETIGNLQRTVYRIARDGRPQGATFWNRETAEQILAGWQQLPEGYHLDRVQIRDGWTFAVSKGTWTCRGSIIDALVQDARAHAAKPAEAPRPVAVPQPAAPRKPSRACRHCGAHVPDGQGSIGSTGLFCGDCYID